MKLLVLGIGNLLLTDDGLGVHAVTELMKEDFPKNVTLMDGGTFTHDVFYLFEEYTHVLVLDILHANKEAGTIYKLTEKELVENKEQRMSIHDIDLLDSLNMASLLYKKRPELFILGMEPHDYLTWSMDLSPKIQESLPAFVAEARKEITRILNSPQQNP